jgi:type 1 fimbria pilin
VLVDGKPAGRGSFRRDDVRAGSHTITATIESLDGCPTATDDVTVRVREEGRTTVTLQPRPCGLLTIDAAPRGARWSVRDDKGTEVASGTAPLTGPVELPVGSYNLRVSASYCADYRADLTVTADRTHRERAHLLCEPSGD